MSSRESGFASIEWMLGLALLVLPAASLALSVGVWAARANVAHAVAQETGRAAALAPAAARILPDGLEAATVLLGAHGLWVRPTCPPAAADCATVAIEGAPERGATISVTVEVTMPAIAVPFVGELGSIRWSAHHAERLDDYRSLPE